MHAREGMDMIGLQRENHAVPFTVDRATTELLQCRKSLERATDSLQLALEILSSLGAEPIQMPVAELEEVLGQLEVAEAAFSQAVG